MSKPELFIVPSLSSFDAVAVCHRPGGMGPPVVAALAADKATARRIVSADYLASRAADDLGAARADAAAARALADRSADALALALADVERLTALNTQLEADIQLLRSAGGAAGATRGCDTPAPKRRAGAAREVKPDYRTAAEVWLSGEKLTRPQRAAFKKSRGPQSVEVIFADGIVLRVSTYLDGQAGLNQAAQFCRASRQAAPATEQRQYPVRLLYDHVAQSLGCEIVELEDRYFSWTGSNAEDAYQSRWLAAVVDEMCKAHKIASSDAMRDAQLNCPAWAEATRTPAQWVRDTTGTWRLVEIRPCPDVLTVQYAED